MQIQRYRKFGGSDMVKFLEEVSKPVYSLDVHTETKELVKSMKDRFNEKKSERGLRPNSIFVNPILPDNFDVGNFMKRWYECVPKHQLILHNSKDQVNRIDFIPIITGTGGEVDNPFELNYDTLFADGITDEALERWACYTRDKCERIVNTRISLARWFTAYKKTANSLIL